MMGLCTSTCKMIGDTLREIATSHGLFAVITILVIYKCIIWYRNPLRKIPGPKGSLIFGNTTDLRSPNDGHQVLVEWGRKYGDIFKTWSVIGMSFLIFGIVLTNSHFSFS